MQILITTICNFICILCKIISKNNNEFLDHCFEKHKLKLNEKQENYYLKNSNIFQAVFVLHNKLKLKIIKTNFCNIIIINIISLIKSFYFQDFNNNNKPVTRTKNLLINSIATINNSKKLSLNKNDLKFKQKKLQKSLKSPTTTTTINTFL
jgi:hypothetical protein